MMHSEELAGGHLTICPLLPFFFKRLTWKPSDNAQF